MHDFITKSSLLLPLTGICAGSFNRRAESSARGRRMKSFLLLRDCHLGQAWDTLAGAERSECLRVLPESLQLPPKSNLWHLSILMWCSSLYSSGVWGCVMFCEVPMSSFPFSFKWINWGEHAKWLSNTYKKGILTPTTVTRHKASFIRLGSRMVDFHLGWAEVFNFQACWCNIFYRFLYFVCVIY